MPSLLENTFELYEPIDSSPAPEVLLSEKELTHSNVDPSEILLLRKTEDNLGLIHEAMVTPKQVL